MNILLLEQAIFIILETIDENSIDFAAWIQAITSIFSVGLGVFTIFVGRKYILTKRQNAKVGFYVDLLIFIKRFKSLLDEHEGFTSYLVDDKYRNDKRIVSMPREKAEGFKPIFSKLCDDFLDYVSKADNNIVPEYSKNSAMSKKDEWNNWYKELIKIIIFVEKCKFINQDIVIYISSEQVDQYISDYDSFCNALQYLEEQLTRAVDYPKKF